MLRSPLLCLAALALAGPLAVVVLAADRAERTDAVVLPFNGQNLDGWKFKHPDRSKWVVGRATVDEKDPARLSVTKILPSADGGPGAREMINSEGGSTDIYTDQKFGDCSIELEFMVPRGSNSGVYVMGEYEVQILDSYGKEKPDKGDLGAIYGITAPRVNAARKPGEWQKFIIDFQAPRFEGDKKTANARFLKVTLNDEVIHENLEVPHTTPSGVTGHEVPEGPLMFQGDHGPVAFRNIRITPHSGK